MNNNLIIGYIATTLSSILYLPQLYHMIQRKSGKDVSYVFLSLSLIAGIFWIAYGTLDNNIPVIISCSTIFTTNFLMLIAKLTYETDIINKVNLFGKKRTHDNYGILNDEFL